jgi:hypothetical protein
MTSYFAREKTKPDGWSHPGRASRRRNVPLCLDRLRIERQRALEQLARLRAIVTRGWFCVCGASPEELIQSIHYSPQGWDLAIKKSVLVSFFAFLLIPFSSALAGYSSLFVFGDSLSDSGNNFLTLPHEVTPLPIPGNAFIPTFPYASKVYTNNQVWAQTLASSLGLSANPSRAGGTDYAYGGARTGTTPADGFPPSLEAQVGSFLSQYGPMIPGNALYVVDGIHPTSAADAITPTRLNHSQCPNPQRQRYSLSLLSGSVSCAPLAARARAFCHRPIPEAE